MLIEIVTCQNKDTVLLLWEIRQNIELNIFKDYIILEKEGI